MCRMQNPLAFPGTTLANQASRLSAQSQVRGVALTNELRGDKGRASHTVRFSPHLFSLVGQLGNLALSPPRMPNSNKVSTNRKMNLFDKRDPLFFTAVHLD